MLIQMLPLKNQEFSQGESWIAQRFVTKQVINEAYTHKTPKEAIKK